MVFVSPFFLRFFLAGVVAFGIFWFTVPLAEKKLFWLDEGYETQANCPLTVRRMLLVGAEDCNPNPAYHLFAKALGQGVGVDSQLLLKLRSISVLCAALLGGGLFFFFHKSFGIAFALMGVALLLCQPLFYRFAIENRAYMLWLSSLGLCVFWSASWIRDLKKGFRPLEVVGASLLAVFVSLVSAPAMAQVVGIIIVALGANYFLQRSEPDSFKQLKRNLWAFAPGLLASMVLGAFYANNTVCRWGDCGEFDLLNTGNWMLVVGVYRVLLVKGGAQEWIINTLVFVGLVSPYFILRYFSKVPELRAAAAISLLSSVLLGLSVLFGIGIALAHYFFIQRAFIYLLLCRVLLATAGAYFLFYLLNVKLPSKARNGLSVFLFSFAVFWVGYEFHSWRAAVDRQVAREIWPKVSLCGRVSQTVHFGFNQTVSLEVPVNAAVIVAKELESCPVRPSGFSYVQFTDGLVSGEVSVTNSVPKDFQPLKFCGKDLVLGGF